MATLTGTLSYTADTQAILDAKVQSIQSIPGYTNVVVNGLTVTFDIEQAE